MRPSHSIRRITHHACATLAVVLALPAPPASAADQPAARALLPPTVSTHADGRQSIESLFVQYETLQEAGWTLEVVVDSQPAARKAALPVIALRSPRPGKAVWILSGIHGEETAGPNAIARAIDAIEALGAVRPVVLLPLLNPHGYANDWRYLNIQDYSETIEGHSVGDASHLLPDTADPAKPRSPSASSPEAGAITAWIVETARSYPPEVSIDLHEDDLIDEGYVYSQGRLGVEDPLARAAVEVLRGHGIPLKMKGETRFGETVSNGLIGPVEDSSIDELMSAETVLINGQSTPGPAAATVLVFETPAARFDLPRRVSAHEALLRELATRLASQPAD